MRHNNERMWQPQHRGSQNLDSLKYTYHLSPEKPFTTQFRNHLVVVSRTEPTFTSSDWQHLPDGGDRTHPLSKVLSLSDGAEFFCEPVGAGHPVYRVVHRGSIVLVEVLPDGTWRVNVPITSTEPEELPEDDAGVGDTEEGSFDDEQ